MLTSPSNDASVAKALTVVAAHGGHIVASDNSILRADLDQPGQCYIFRSGALHGKGVFRFPCLKDAQNAAREICESNSIIYGIREVTPNFLLLINAVRGNEGLMPSLGDVAPRSYSTYRVTVDINFEDLVALPGSSDTGLRWLVDLFESHGDFSPRWSRFDVPEYKRDESPDRSIVQSIGDCFDLVRLPKRWTYPLAAGAAALSIGVGCWFYSRYASSDNEIGKLDAGLKLLHIDLTSGANPLLAAKEAAVALKNRDFKRAANAYLSASPIYQQLFEHKEQQLELLLRFTELSIDHESLDSPELKSLQEGLGAITAFQELMSALTEEMMRLHVSQELDAESKRQIERALNFEGILFSMHATQQRNILPADLS